MKIRFRNVLIGIAIAAIVVVGGTVGLIAFTNRPDFCRSCHYMEPYYDTWASSKHKDVSCDLCHYTPGYDNMIMGKIHDINQLVKYATNAYRKSKPWAEIEDASCLREGCHDTRLLEGQVMFGKVKFDHRPHLTELRRGRQLRCTSCHSQIVQGDHMTVTPLTCVLCHFKETKEHVSGRRTDECELCHYAPTEPEDVAEAGYDHTAVLRDSLDCRRCHGDMVVGDGAVDENKCYFCHWDQERLQKFNDSELMHLKHITENKIECEQCHSTMTHKWKTPEHAAGHCEGCHENMHESQLSLFAGTGGKGVEGHPNPMYKLSMSCQGCHVQHEVADTPKGGLTSTASGKSCEPCHGRGYDRLLDQWNRIIEEKVQFLSRLAGRVDKAYTSTSAHEAVGIADSIENARANLDIVKYGRPVHNIVYSNDLLASAYRQLGGAAHELGVFVEQLDLFTRKSIVPSDCRNCHATIDDIRVDVQGRLYDHGVHLAAGYACQNCHTHQRRHGETFAAARNCNSCHHRSDNCPKCHQLQQASYYGGVFYGFEFEPSLMAEAEVDCLDCHNPEGEGIIRPSLSICADCHDAEYEEMGREWQYEVADKVQELLAVLDTARTVIMDKATQESLADDLRSFERIRSDRSIGIHNYEEVLRVVEEMIERYRQLAAGS